jgi:hypothetical protein
VKKIVRLLVFFSASFVLVLLGTSAVRYLQLWIEAAKMIPAQQEAWPGIVAAAQWALPAALYTSILLALSYSARREISIPLSMFFIFVLSVLISGGAFLGIHQLETLVPRGTVTPRHTLGTPGVILSQGDTAIVLLEDPSNALGRRVVSIPERPLIYQEVPTGPNNTILALPPVPFTGKENLFFTDLLVDLTLSARQIDARFRESPLSFGIYLGGLCLLLVSLRVVLELSSWPLANLFLGVLAFRGVLALEIVFNDGDVQQFLGGFLGRFFPLMWLGPFLLCNAAALIVLMTALIFLAKGRRKRHG